MEGHIRGFHSLICPSLLFVALFDSLACWCRVLLPLKCPLKYLRGTRAAISFIFLLFALLVPFEILQGHSNGNLFHFPSFCLFSALWDSLGALKRQFLSFSFFLPFQCPLRFFSGTQTAEIKVLWQFPSDLIRAKKGCSSLRHSCIIAPSIL